MNFWQRVEYEEGRRAAHGRVSMQNPYGEHPNTKNTLAGLTHEQMVHMPESMLKMVRRLSRMAGKRGTVGPAIIGTRILLCVGDGLSLTPTPKTGNIDKLSEQAELIWGFFSRQKISSCGLFDIHQVVSASLENSHHAGDCFLVIRYSKEQKRRFGFGTVIDIIPGDTVCNPNLVGNNGRIINGIEYDSQWKAIYLHYCVRLPNMSGTVWKKVDLVRENWIRIESPKRREAGMNRSIPTIAPVLDEIQLLECFRRAYVSKAITNSKLTFTVEGIGDFSYPGGLGDDELLDPSFTRLEDATIVKSPAGGKVNAIPEVSPTADAMAFSKAIAGEISAACFIPIEVLLKSFDKSYSAGTGALNECWRIVKPDRKEAEKIYRSVYEEVLKEAWISGDFPAAGFDKSPFSRHLYVSSRWDGSPRGSLNPLAEYKARELSEKRCWTTGANNAAELGSKRSSNVKIRQREVKEEEMIYGKAETPKNV